MKNKLLIAATATGRLPPVKVHGAAIKTRQNRSSSGGLLHRVLNLWATRLLRNLCIKEVLTRLPVIFFHDKCGYVAWHYLDC